MTQRTASFRQNVHRPMLGNQSPDYTRKSTLYCLSNDEQLAFESSRARYIRQLVNPEELSTRDFSAYFYRSEKNSIDPTYATTSHISPVPPKKVPVLPAFPLVQSLRWNPYVETSSIDEFKDESDEEPKLKCRCDNCLTKKCPSRYSSSTLKPSIFKDNIMTFCDRNTMTPTLTDFGCGCKTVSSTRMSDVSVTASDITVKETQGRMYTQRLNDAQRYPAPILKSNKAREMFSKCSSDNFCNAEYDPVENTYEEAERDVSEPEDYVEPSRVNLIKASFRHKKKKHCSNSRRIIYNEGISDLVACQFLNTPEKVPPPNNLKKKCSKVSVKNRCWVNENDIPYSHRSDSRYHQSCKRSESRVCINENEESRHFVASPVMRKSVTSKPVQYYRVPSIALPKKVLTSEQNIEYFIKRSCPKVIAPASGRRK